MSPHTPRHKQEVWSTWVLSDNENTEQAYQEWKARVEEWDTVGVVPRLVRANVRAAHTKLV